MTWTDNLGARGSVPPGPEVSVQPSVAPAKRQKSPATSAKASRRVGELMVAAKEIFERDGYFGTRVADIVALAHASHGTFYTYFDSKDDVLAALVEQFVEDVYNALEVPATAGTSYEHLEDSIRHFMTTYAEHAGMQRILEQAVTVSDHFLQIRSAIRARFVDRIEKSIISLQRHGVAAQDLDSLHTAHALGGMVQDYAFALYILRQPLDEESAIVAMTRVWAGAVGIAGERARPGASVPRRSAVTAS